MSKVRQYWTSLGADKKDYYRKGFEAGRWADITDPASCRRFVNPIVGYHKRYRFNQFRLGFSHGYRKRPENRGLRNWLRWQYRFLVTGKSLRRHSYEQYNLFKFNGIFYQPERLQ